MKELSLYRELAKNNYRTGTWITTMVRSPAKLSQSPGNSDRIGCPTKLARLLKRTKADPHKSGVHSPAAGVDDKLEQNLRRLLQPTIYLQPLVLVSIINRSKVHCKPFFGAHHMLRLLGLRRDCSRSCSRSALRRESNQIKSVRAATASFHAADLRLRCASNQIESSNQNDQWGSTPASSCYSTHTRDPSLRPHGPYESNLMIC
jgi:hypothetical protein